MRHVLISGLLFVLTSGIPAMPLDADGSATAHDEDGQRFRRAVGEHYRIGDDVVAEARKQGIRDDELPVVFHIAGSAHVQPRVVVEMRRKGKRSWMQIAAHFGLTAESFHTPTKQDHGPPYGRAWGYYKNKKRSEWASIELDDSAIVQLTNVKFLSKHYGLTADEVIQQHRSGAGLVELHADVKGLHDRKEAGRPHSGAKRADEREAHRRGPARDDRPADEASEGRGRSGKKGGARGDSPADRGSKGRGKDKKGAGR